MRSRADGNVVSRDSDQMPSHLGRVSRSRSSPGRGSFHSGPSHSAPSPRASAKPSSAKSSCDINSAFLLATALVMHTVCPYQGEHILTFKLSASGAARRPSSAACCASGAAWRHAHCFRHRRRSTLRCSLNRLISTNPRIPGDIAFRLGASA